MKEKNVTGKEDKTGAKDEEIMNVAKGQQDEREQKEDVTQDIDKQSRTEKAKKTPARKKLLSSTANINKGTAECMDEDVNQQEADNNIEITETPVSNNKKARKVRVHIEVSPGL